MEHYPYTAPRPGAVGLGKFAAPKTPAPTPPSPSFGCAGPCSKDSTVSSGDLLGSPSKRKSSPRRSRCTDVNEPSPPIGLGMESYRYPTPPPGAIGLGKFCCPATNMGPTPPSPPLGAPCYRDSTVSSGDLCPSSNRRGSPRRSGSPETFDQASIGAPLAQSTPVSQFKYTMTMRKQSSSSSIPESRRRQSDTVCTDDLLDSRRSSPRCPTLGVTPVHSAVSLTESNCANMGSGNRQNISRSIENELRAREVQERNQLETDLTRWQEARRRLVMNTASMGS